MNLGFSELIESIENEISLKYRPKAINWCDDNCDMAWSNAINKFESALIAFQKGKVDMEYLKHQGEIYKQTCLDLIERFKAANGEIEVDDFLARQKEHEQLSFDQFTHSHL